MPSKLTQEEFLKRCVASQQKGYDFSRAVYVNHNTKVDVVCPEHGVFSSVPQSLMRGIGCQKCAWRTNGLKKRWGLEKFTREASEKHGYLYDYSEVNYVDCDTKVTIICNRCNNYFKMTPYSHLSAGQGCPSCAVTGFTPSKEGYLYVFHDYGDLTKVGITNKNPIFRCKDINRRASKSFEILKSYYFEDGHIPATLEKDVLRYLEGNYRNCADKFNGSTECFYNVNLAQLLNKIEELIVAQAAQT